MYINKINGMNVEERELREVIANDEYRDAIYYIKEIMHKNALKDSDGLPVFSLDSKEFVSSIINSKRGDIVLYFDKSNFVGFFELICPDDPYDIEDDYDISLYLPECDIKNMGVIGLSVVMPEYEGNNLQVQMLERMEEMAYELGITSLIGRVHPENIYSCNSFDESSYSTLILTEYYGKPSYLKYKEIKKSKTKIKD